MKSLGYVPDGYFFPGYIAAVPDLHPALSFSYRPMTSDEYQGLRDAVTDKRTDERSKLINGEVSKRVQSWDLKDPAGDPVPATAAVIGTLIPCLWDKLIGIVQGYRPSDPDPRDQETSKPMTGPKLLQESQKN